MIRAMRRVLGGTVAGLLACAGLTGLVVGPAQPTAAAARNTGLSISPVYTNTLVGDFDQAGNTLFDCQSLIGGAALPAGGCQRNVLTALATPGTADYNNQVIQKYMDRDTNSATHASSSATVNVPAGAKVVFAELSWLGTTQKDQNPALVWDPNIWMSPMKMSVGDDQHYVSINPDQGTSIMPGSPASDTNDFYYSASADVTRYLALKTGQITVWGADAPFPANGFSEAGLGWNIVVVYQYPSVDLTASPPHVGKLVTVQTGFSYQQSGKPATNTTVTVPAVSDPDHVHVGLIAGEGDTGLGGDTFSINGHNIAHPVTGQTNNFFVSYAQGATDPNWTSNFSTDNVSWTLASGIVHAGDTSVLLTTTTNGDGYFLAGANTAIPVPSIGLTKTVTPTTYTTVGQQLTYTFTVTNTSAVTIHGLSVTDPLLGGTIANCNHAGDLAGGASYQCTATYAVTQADIARGHIDNTATAHGLGEANEALTAQASATTTTSTNLSITKTGHPKPVHVGDPFTYTITVTNNGPADAANVKVTDPLPTGLANPTVTTGNATIAGGVLNATIPLLPHTAPNNTFTITVTGTIASSFTGTSIANTATVAAGGNTNCEAGSTDPACSATDTTQVLQPAPITITKVTSNSTPKPGETFTYTVQVKNTSTTTTATAVFNDTIPANLINASWTCAASAGSTCGTSTGTGNITGVSLSLMPLGVATFTITVTVDPAFQGGTITNTATATPGVYTFCEANPTAATCSVAVPVTVTPNPALLTITKTHTPNNPSPGAGQPITYTVTVTNPSTSTIAHATLTDPVPPMIVASGGWTTATTITGTTATPASATTGFPTGVVLVIAPGGTVTFTIHATVSATYDGTQVLNVATATPGPNTGCADMRTTCVAEDPFTNPAQLEITKTHTPLSPTPVPGQRFTYDVTVTNSGSSATGSGTFSDPLPDPPLDAAGATWTCTPTGATSTCGAPTGTESPAGMAITVAPNGGTVVFAITVTIRTSEVPVTVRNVGTVTTNPGTTCTEGGTTCNGEDTFEAAPQTALITITKSRTPTTPAQGGAITYTVVVANTSALTTAHATLTDPVPAMIVADGGWTAVPTAGSTATPASATTGFPTGVVLVIAPGGTVTFTIHAHVAVPYNGTTVTNTATATPGTNTACENGNLTCQAQVSFTNPAQLDVVKTHAPSNPDPVPGQRFTYDVTITNPSTGATATGSFSDPLPDPPLDAAGATWTCTPTGATSTCGAPTGTGSPAGVAITVAPNGGTVVFAITVTIRTSEVPVTVRNVGTVTTNPGTTCTEGGTTCNGEDTFEATPQTALITITKDHTPANPTPPAAGEALTYTIVVNNTNQFTTAHATLTDPVPAMIVADGGWTAVPTAGSTATPASAGTGFPTGAVLVIAPLGTVTFTIHVHVAMNYDGSQVTNTATATPGTNTACADGNSTCLAEDQFTNPARLEVSKTHSPTDPDPVPGQRFTYTVTVTNPGNSAVGSGTFSDPLPDPPLDAAGATWTCTPTGATSTCGAPTGTGSPAAVAITVAPDGGTVVFAITVTIRISDVAVTVHNVASVTPNPGTACTDGSTTCNAEDTFEATPELAPLTITKSQSPDTPGQGDLVTYTVVVTNTNQFTTAHATLTDPVPAMIVADGGWTAVPTAGSTATPASATTGFPTGVVLVIAPLGTVTFTITAHVAVPYNGTTVTNTATATPGLNTICADGDLTCQAQVSFTNPAQLDVTKTHTPTNPDPVPGQTFTYTVTITNPSTGATATGSFSDPLPDPPLDAAGATWTCTPTGATSTCGAPTGTGSPAGVAITVAPDGGTVVFAITVTIRTSEVPVAVHNVGTVTTNPGTTCTEGGTTCDGEDTFEAAPELAPLTITKSQAPDTPDIPGQGDLVTYTVVVTNTSQFTTAHATISDPVPAQIIADGGWTAVPTAPVPRPRRPAPARASPPGPSW